MKYQSIKAFLISIFLNIIFISIIFAQENLTSLIIQDRIDQIWTTGQLDIGYANVASKHILPRLYERNDFQLIWQNLQNVNDLLNELKNIEEDGLNPEDYHLSTLLIQKLHLEQSESPEPSLLADYDILLTDSLIRLICHLYFGKVDPENLHPSWRMTREINDTDPVENIERTLRSNQLADALKKIRPQLKSYNLMRAALKKYREIQEAGGWEPIPEGPTLKVGMTDERIPKLRKRLAVTGHFEGTNTKSDHFDEELEKAVVLFQKRHRLVADGAVGENTYKALNVPVKRKIDQIRVNLERSRWISRNIPEEFIIVDIAGFRIYHYQNFNIKWTSKVQVGKYFRKTPVFNSQIKYVVFNPTWTVPPTILRKDILPRIKKNPDYLQKMKIDVIDRNGRIVDPSSVDWSTYSGKNVPYTFRQEPGPHNALGRIKFILPNKHFIYLHDSPSRSLYALKDRAFSSGCIRVEKNIELAEILLDDPEKWNEQNIQNLIDTLKTKKVYLPKPMPISLLYWTVRFDEKGNIIFKKDIYARDGEVLNGLNEEFIGWQRRFLD
ncbi:MAG: L,D-transpeptidase family protein [Thermodesulfobacteriota bacterium]|nr:L,D-transpeptidase family protein [Thermodesulfobacteriota bacterium]